MLKLIVDGQAVLLPVKVVPGASRTRCVGEWDGRARIAVAAPPEKGKANRALMDFVAKQLGIDRRAVALVSGETTALKTLRIQGVAVEALRRAFASSKNETGPAG